MLAFQKPNFQNLTTGSWAHFRVPERRHACGLPSPASSLVHSLNVPKASSFGTLKKVQRGEAYVDDTNLWHSLQSAYLQELAQEMERTAQVWEQLLFTTGCALALENFFVAMKWRYENDDYTLELVNSLSVKIELSSGNNYAIKRSNLES